MRLGNIINKTVMRKKTKKQICRINLDKSVDSQWEKVDRGVLTVAEGKNLGFECNGMVVICVCCVRNP